MFYKRLITIFAFSLVVHVIFALPQKQPHTMDEAYNYINAVTLSKGEGLIEHFLWNYLDSPDRLPQPSNLYWMPLSSFIAWFGLQIGGISYSMAQIGFIILAALLPVMGHVITWHVSQNSRHAVCVAGLMLFSGFYFSVWTSVDSFSPFALCGMISLYAIWRGIESQSMTLRFWAGLSGIMAGLCHLARADGILIIVTIVLGIIIARMRKIIDNRTLFRTSMYVIVGYMLIMFSWFSRNMYVMGMPLATGGGKTIWLRNYAEIFSYGHDLSLQYYFAWGWKSILKSKLSACWINFQTLFAVQGLIVAFPLAIIGAWQKRHILLFQIAYVYTALLFIIMTIVFTYPGIRGGLFHSGGIILPFMFSMAMFGLDSVVDKIARQRRRWRAKSAKVVFSCGFIFIAILVSLFVYYQRFQAESQTNLGYAQAVQFLQNESATVMVGNPPAWLYYGGYQAIIIPTESIEVTLTVADRYGATYLAIDSNFIYHPLQAYLSENTSQPRLQLLGVFEGEMYLYRILH
ncbi:MAG: hypothetical protein B6242_07400 [Anaerolineaceae bacterium 4572_78]|nr:MAG: hypothetical protein B6242_07400 [Anaerolineaceae bacterium 4572_78]